jgi:hypothetical protein
MVTKMTFPHGLRATLNYHEKKVQEGKAECIGAAGYLREPHEMNFYHKLEGFNNRNVLNDRAVTKTLHVSINFDPSEKLSNETLFQIAAAYMERIGFGDQPCLVYKHLDAGHPHLHVVSTTIRGDGSRINTHNLGSKQSEKARKQVEALFGLVRAGNTKKEVGPKLDPATIGRVIYGKAETKKSISEVVSHVFSSYAFSSFEQYNAALRQFNVLADRGKEGGWIYRHQGLMYQSLNEKGKRVGVPIKASSLDFSPTLKNLEKRFEVGELIKRLYREPLKAKIDQSIPGAPSGFNQWKSVLESKGVFVLLNKGSEGRPGALTYVDNEHKCVFSEGDLGDRYTAMAIQSRLSVHQSARKQDDPEREVKPSISAFSKEVKMQGQARENVRLPSKDLMKELLAAKNMEANVPAQLLPKKKNRKKRNPGL